MIIQRLFSEDDNKKPVRPKTEESKTRHQASVAIGGLTFPLSQVLYKSTVQGEKVKMANEINNRIRETADRARRGDAKAMENMWKMGNSDPRELTGKLREAIDKSPRLKRAKIRGAAKAAIPIGLFAYGIHGLKKTADRNEKAMKEYKKELSNWKRKNKE